MPDLIVPPFRTALLTANGKSLTAIEGAGTPQDGRITIETTREWWLFWRMLAELGNAGLLMITFGVHADRPLPDGMPDGAIYVESDRSGVIYQNQGGEWHYLAGTMWGTLSPDQRPTDLGVNDAGFDFRSTDPPPREYVWSGTVWVEATAFIDPTTTKGDLIARGAAAPATRVAVGSNGQVLTADSAQALGVKWSTPAAAGSPQTPWASDIDAFGFRLLNAGNVGIGNALASLPDPTTGPRLVLGDVAAANPGRFTMCAVQSVSGTVLGQMSWANYSIAGADKRIASIAGVMGSATNSGHMAFNTWNAGSSGERMRITEGGNVGINNSNPLSRLSVVGLPTSSAGLGSGDIWRDAAAGNVLKIVP